MEYKKVKRVGNNQAGFTFEVEVPTDSAEMTNGANFQNAEQVQQAIAQSSGGLVIETETTTTVQGFAVPVLTAEQVVAIYNAVASGKTVTITDPSGNYHFNIDQADNVSGEISVEYKFFNTMYVTYTLVDDTVTVTGEVIGGGKRYLHNITLQKGNIASSAVYYNIVFDIETNSNTVFNWTSLINYLKDYEGKTFMANGIAYNLNLSSQSYKNGTCFKIYIPNTIASIPSLGATIYSIKYTINNNTIVYEPIILSATLISDPATVTDNVIEL